MRKLTKTEIENGSEMTHYTINDNNWVYYENMLPHHKLDGKEMTLDGVEYLPIPCKEFNINISFTKSEIENLIGKLDGIEDCGPYGEGWTSDELLGLLTKLNNALEDLK